MVAAGLQVEVTQRGNELRLSGDSVHPAARLLQQLYALVVGGYPLHTSDVGHAIRILRGDPEAFLDHFFNDTVGVTIDGRPICPRSPGQRRYVHALRGSDVVLAVGPAGTGKTYLAMTHAVSLLLRNQVKRIVLTRPAVEAGEKLGFLPGDLNEKVDPYLRPLFDALADMLPPDRTHRMIERRVIEVAPLAFMRGRTLDDAFVILDEAQNTTPTQMKMFLTRLGRSSRMAVNGDVSQIDLPRGVKSGFVHALRALSEIPRIDIVRFGTEDVVRHPLVAEIIEAWDTAPKASDSSDPTE